MKKCILKLIIHVLAILLQFLGTIKIEMRQRTSFFSNNFNRIALLTVTIILLKRADSLIWSFRICHATIVVNVSCLVPVLKYKKIKKYVIQIQKNKFVFVPYSSMLRWTWPTCNKTIFSSLRDSLSMTATFGWCVKYSTLYKIWIYCRFYSFIE